MSLADAAERGLLVKKSAAILIVMGMALLVFAFTVPAYMTGQARTLPTDLELTVVSESPQGYTQTAHLTTAPTEKVDEIAVQVEKTTEDESGEVVSDIVDKVTLIGHSRFPVLEPTASLEGSPSDHTGEIREGLHYFFPANTLRNSYPYYDMVLGDTEPVDYLSRDGDVHTYYQHRQHAPLDEATNYSVERTLEVERHSGIILHKHEIMIFHEPGGDREVEFSYTGETQDQLAHYADGVTDTLLAARVIAFFGKFLGLVLVGFGVFHTGIFRTRR